MLLLNTCKNQLIILFYFLQFGVDDSIYEQKNALYITCTFINEKIIRGVLSTPVCVSEKNCDYIV